MQASVCINMIDGQAPGYDYRDAKDLIQSSFEASLLQIYGPTL